MEKLTHWKLRNKFLYPLYAFILLSINAHAQTISISDVIKKIENQNPQLKMYFSEIISMDTLANGAKSWMPPQFSSGFFMTPYDIKMWKGEGINNGMGSFMFGVTQMIPNFSRINSEYKYMKSMSSVEKEKKNFIQNQLFAQAKLYYYQIVVLTKRKKVLEESYSILEFMIKSMEVRYKYNMDKLPTYYKAKSELSKMESMIIMTRNNISQNRIELNVLMAENPYAEFDVDTIFDFKSYDILIKETKINEFKRSDIKAIDNSINLNDLSIDLEKSKLRPEFGVKYEHMASFGGAPQLYTLMGMVNIPMPWSTKMNKSSINSLKYKNEALEWQKGMIKNEVEGMLSKANTEIKNLNEQYSISKDKIIPALKKNFELSLLAWQNNLGGLFEVLDAWEILNNEQIVLLEKAQLILEMQVEIEKQLEIR